MSSEKKSKRQERRERQLRQERLGRLVTIGLIVGGAALVVLAVVWPQIKRGLTPPAEVKTVDVGTHPDAKDNSMGNPNAPITIEEFSDFQCPFCARFHEETEPLVRQYYVDTGKVRFVYRTMGNFVSDNVARGGGPVSTESQDAGLAAYCAGDQNKFWEMHAYLFGNAVGENEGAFAPQRLKLIAAKAGLNMDQFNSCYDSGKFRERVKQDGIDGQAAGVTGTPSFRISYTVNGQTTTDPKLIEGAQPFTEFQQRLEAILAQIGAQ